MTRASVRRALARESPQSKAPTSQLRDSKSGSICTTCSFSDGSEDHFQSELDYTLTAAGRSVAHGGENLAKHGIGRKPPVSSGESGSTSRTSGRARNKESAVRGRVVRMVDDIEKLCAKLYVELLRNLPHGRVFQQGKVKVQETRP